VPESAEPQVAAPVAEPDPPAPAAYEPGDDEDLQLGLF
jgi:hypothetical protein